LIILKTKTRRKKRTYSYKEKTFLNIIFFLETEDASLEVE
jgi:hypothetical protein